MFGPSGLLDEGPAGLVTPPAPPQTVTAAQAADVIWLVEVDVVAAVLQGEGG